MQRQREERASAVECGLMIAAIAAVITAVVFMLGGIAAGRVRRPRGVLLVADELPVLLSR
jgi:hypothetical protein